MAIDVLGLVFAASPRTAIGGEVEIPLDAAVVVEHGRRSDLSQEAIEDGTSISDHAIAQPEELTIEGIVSDHPVKIFGGVLGGAILGIGAGVEQPSRSAWDLLVEAEREHKRLRITTSYGTYEDMVIVALDLTQTKETAHALRFRAQLRRVLFARTTEASLLSEVVEGISDLASGHAAHGQQPAQVPTDTEDALFETSHAHHH